MIDSQDKPSPDSPGRWWVTTRGGRQYGIIVGQDQDGELYNFETQPGDKWQNVDALEAERDAARQEVERLTKDLELALALNHSSILKHIQTLEEKLAEVTEDRDLAVEEKTRLTKELASLSEKYDQCYRGLRSAEHELASLRAKGETDKQKGKRSDKRTVMRTWQYGDNGELLSLTDATYYGEEASRAT